MRWGDCWESLVIQFCIFLSLVNVLFTALISFRVLVSSIVLIPEDVFIIVWLFFRQLVPIIKQRNPGMNWHRHWGHAVVHTAVLLWSVLSSRSLLPQQWQLRTLTLSVGVIELSIKGRNASAHQQLMSNLLLLHIKAELWAEQTCTEGSSMFLLVKTSHSCW